MTGKERRKQEIAQKIKSLRIASGLTQSQVAERLGVTYQAISNYERGKNSIETDVLLAMCDIYHADPIVILQPGVYICPVCGFFYNSDSISDVKEHEELHEAFCTAVRYFGDCCCSKDRWAKMKSAAYDILHSYDFDETQKANALLELMKVYFSRSVSAWGYSLEHPKFDEYVAMLLNQERFQRYDGAFSILLAKFGKKPGIPANETMYRVREVGDAHLGVQIATKKASPYSSEAMKLAADYDRLDEYGQRMLRLVASEEVARHLGTVKPGSRSVIRAAARSGGISEIEEIRPEEVSSSEIVP